MNQNRRKIRVATLSVFSNATLVALKIIVGVSIGSVSIISEAIHSGVDLVAALIALFSVKTSGIPADRNHPFGHGKIENISGTIEALLIFVAAGWIIYEAIHKFADPAPLTAVGWGVAVMLFSAVVNLVVSEMLFKVGRETDSIALQADAWHLRTDVYTSVGVMIGLALIWLAQNVYPHRDFLWIDPLAAIIVALLIIKAAWRLTIESAGDLLDASLPPAEEEWIKSMISAHHPAIHGFHHLRTRKAGNFRFIEFHLKVAPRMSVADSHAITETLTWHIDRKFSAASVTVHVEPCDGDCQGKCLAGCLLSDDERQPFIAESRP